MRLLDRFAVRRALLLSGLAMLSVAAAPPVAAADEVTSSSAARLTAALDADMTRPHEVRPNGVPHWWSWAQRPFVRPGAVPAGFSGFTGWGQVYRCAGAPHDPDDIIELRDMQTWMRDANGWRRVQFASYLSGSAFREDFSGSAVAANVVSRGTAGTKVRMREGYNFHFWPAPRAAFDPARVASIVVMVRARLIGVGARANCVGVSVGGDYWRSVSVSTVGPGNVNVTGAGVGRMKRVQGAWRVFSMTLNPSGLPGDAPPLSPVASELR
jgi:hypothetical protein